MRLTHANGRVITAALLCAMAMTGCTSIRNTVPARALNAPDIAQSPRSAQRPLNFMLLRQDPPEAHLLGRNDVLGIYIERILGQATTAPPVHYPELGDLPPAIGYPIPIREDGTISLPLIPPLHVEGLTLAQAHRLIQEAYTVERKLLPPGDERILVTLMRPRTYNVLVIREDTVGAPRVVSGEREGELTLGRSKRGETFSIKLPAYENDVLGALSRSGGLPGVDAKNQITIIRGGFRNARENPVLTDYLNRGPGAMPFSPGTGYIEGRLSDQPLGTLLSDATGRISDRPVDGLQPGVVGLGPAPDCPYGGLPPGSFPPGSMLAPGTMLPPQLSGLPMAGANIITIPLRVGPYEMPPNIREEDIILEDGDVVFVESREAEVFYTGGLLRGGQFPIPRDYDLDVLGAIAMSGGSISAAAGGTATGFNSAVGSIIPPSRITIIRQYQGQQVAIRTSVQDALSDPRERILVQPNDLVMLEYTPREAFMNMIISNFQVTLALQSLWQ
jgi:protein involved in polysaccharide export with SLBB domain